MIGIAVGILIGICAPVQALLFSSNTTILSPLGVSIEAVGQPLVTLSTLIMAASLAQTVKEMNMPEFVKNILYYFQNQTNNIPVNTKDSNAENVEMDMEIVPRSVHHTSFDEILMTLLLK